MHKRNKLALLLALILALGAAWNVCAAATLKLGSNGADVEALQQKLARWGYYQGPVDGKYGAQTQQAVMRFQGKNGLVPDGMVGPSTAEALGLQLQNSGNKTESESGGGNGKSDLYLLSRLVYGEARGESYKGQVAVAAVVLNRVKSAEFPNTVSGVVYQSGAFSVVDDGQINLAPDESAIKAARDAMNGWDPTNGCLYYYNPAKTSHKWMTSHETVITIGNHAFF